MRPPRTVVIVIVGIVLVLAAGAVIAKVVSTPPPAVHEESPDPTPSVGGPITGSPSDDPSPSPSSTAPSAPGPSPVAPVETTQPEPAIPSVPDASVVVTYAEWEEGASTVEVGAYVGVVEEGGTCTLILTHGSVTRTSELPALPDVSTTSCSGFQVPGADLSPGIWEAVVSYESATSAGDRKSVV